MGDISGVFFSNQILTAKALGALTRRLLTDGVIDGCAATYSGNTLTVGAGYLVACGRLMHIPAAVALAVDQATTGVARVVVTVDLTATATTSEFAQAALSVEYAATESAFSPLTQGDINLAGSTYEYALCVASLGAAGITAITTAPATAALQGGVVAGDLTLAGKLIVGDDIAVANEPAAGIAGRVILVEG